ncbi:hypothetical protein B5F37_11600 [Drancourtella sp. An210]|nr:hypothetical protein B5F37_11600 [Drancourtella sp. An210]
MNDAEILLKVKDVLGVTGEYQDNTLSGYIQEVRGFLCEAGVSVERQTPGIIARGVSDLWNGSDTFSSYFMQRAAQLSYEGEKNDE